MPRTAALVAGLVLTGVMSAAGFAQAPAAFVAHEIATGLRGGYQTIAVDLNKDGKLDLIALASNLPELAWYENPTWTRHVLHDSLTGLINVSARDLDNDGIPELAVARGFSTNPAQSAGIVSLLTHGADPREPWSMKEIDRTPTAHRMRWYEPPSGEVWLINAPLSGPTALQPDYKGQTPIYAYRAPEWKREVVTQEEQGVVHAVEPIRLDGTAQVLLSAGFMGIHQYEYTGGRWVRSEITAGNPVPWPKGGSSDVALGRLGQTRFLAAIEPWHGEQVSIYHDEAGKWQRQVIDTTLTDGHTIVVADFNGDGRDDVVVGQRGGARSVWLYTSAANGTTWSRSTVDEGTMAGAGCTGADLNGDGRVDLACIGTATANLKWYENVRR